MLLATPEFNLNKFYNLVFSVFLNTKFPTINRARKKSPIFRSFLCFFKITQNLLKLQKI